MASQCICGNKFGKHKSHSLGFNSLKCSSCGTVKFEPKSSSSSESFSYQSSLKYNENIALSAPALRWGHYKILECLSGSNASVLELGCHNGFFVRNLLQKGINAYGIDVNVNAVHSGKAVFDLHDRLFLANESSIKLDVNTAVLIDVLEHVSDPSAFLQVVIQRYPQISCLLISGPTTTKIFNDKSDFPPHHLWRFSEKGIKDMLASRGFVITSVRYERNPVLLLRNLVGRILYGFGRREFYGETPPFTGMSFLDLSISSNAYRLLERLFPFNYCSVLIAGSRIESTRHL